MKYFETRFLEEADKFIAELEPKAAKKVFYNIDIAEQANDPKLFKKLKNEIWEFRTLYAGLQIRLLAFLGQDRPSTNTCYCDTWLYQKGAKDACRRNCKGRKN